MNNGITKQDFSATLDRITLALEQADSVYPQLIATVAPVDAQLAAKIKACADADAELLKYIQVKVEKGENKGLIATVVGFLLNR